jgi:predicted acyl esterase
MASSTVDTDFAARLIDEYPPSADYPSGFALLIAGGILRMRYRDDRPVASLLIPHEPYAVTLDLQATSNVCKRGHRIRRDVTSAAFPEHDVAPNTGEVLGQHTHTVVARYSS